MSQLISAISPRRRPETELLLLCGRTRLKPDKAQQLRELLAEGIDWDYLVKQALYHGTIPLLFRNLSVVCPDEIPKAALNQLKDCSNGIACSNLYLTGELLHLLNLFRERGIRALPLKGPVLAAVAYGNLSLRQFCDLDILVDKANMVKAKEMLISQGYNPKLSLTAAQEKAHLESHHDYGFVRSRDGSVVEIQWNTTQWSFAFPFDFDAIWKRRDFIFLAGEKVHTLRREDLLLVLCVHGAKHQWEQLKWICDIAELVVSYNDTIDWDRLALRARAKGGQRMLFLGLYLAHDLLGANLPNQVLRIIHHDSQIKLLAGLVREELFRDRSQPAELRNERPFFYWRVRERVRDKLAIGWRYFPEYFLRMVVPNYRDRTFLKLPAFLSLGYYLVRPLRLATEYRLERKERTGSAGK